MPDVRLCPNWLQFADRRAWGGFTLQQPGLAQKKCPLVLVLHQSSACPRQKSSGRDYCRLLSLALGPSYLIGRLDITCRWGWVVSGTRDPALNPAATLWQEIGRIGDFWPVRRMQVIGKGDSMLCQSTRADYYCSGPDDHVNENDNVLLSFCLLTQYLNGNVP